MKHEPHEQYPFTPNETQPKELTHSEAAIPDLIASSPEYQINRHPESALAKMAREPTFLPTYTAVVDELRQIHDRSPETTPWIRDAEAEYGNRLFEIWNQEYINALGEYLASRAEHMGVSEEKPLKILEVGAGDGRLSYFLSQQLAVRLPNKAKIVATDSKDWSIKPVFPVETASCKDAVKTFKPDIVIWSWMPHQADYTDVMRSEDSVQEYILIGESGHGAVSGDSWLTWGEDDWLEPEHEGEVPPYKQDGFEQVQLDTLTDLQVSRMRLISAYGDESSSTVSFRRMPVSSNRQH